ncbi:melanotransferrin-like, partial [Pocillopora damicornis]|uniref:melanotransferrin-like n=1 Tax=Pocillopora damicornis TaxID=46731 RepID=UPI000F54FDF7
FYFLNLDVKNPDIDKNNDNPDNLCALCEDECRTNKGKYSGYSGALKCLMDDVGEVAFVKHTTVPANSSGYLYLCENGGTGAIGNHDKCNLAEVPTHAVMTREGSSDKANYASILLKASDEYGNDTGSVFRMFDSGKWAGKDLLFKDSTIKLVDVSAKNYTALLGYSYLKDLEALNACPTTPIPATTTPTSGTKQNRPYFIGSVVFVLTALFLSGAVYH